jgi:hypothetical protein
MFILDFAGVIRELFSNELKNDTISTSTSELFVGIKLRRVVQLFTLSKVYLYFQVFFHECILYFGIGHPFCSELTILCKICSVLLMTPFG